MRECILWFIAFMTAIVASLIGCTSEVRREGPGCESYCALCINSYRSCGDKVIGIDKSTKPLPKIKRGE